MKQRLDWKTGEEGERAVSTAPLEPPGGSAQRAQRGTFSSVGEESAGTEDNNPSPQI